MPRQRRGAATPARSAPSRPTAPPAARPAPPQTQQRSQPYSTATHPGQQAPPQQTSAGPGLFGQMASTAAGVAVGSSIGHAIGGFFGGGHSAPAAEGQSQQAPAQPMDNGLYQANNGTSAWETPAACENDVRAFRKCMDDNQGNLGICGWYLDQLKACQAAAKQY